MQVFKQWPLYFIGRLLPAAVSFGAISIYTRLLDPGSFGIYALLLSTMFLAGMVGYSWLRVATLRMMASVEASECSDYMATIAVAFAGTSILVSAALVIILRLCDPSLPLPLELLAIAAAIASNWFELNVAVVISRIHLLSYGLLQAGRSIAAFVATVLLIWAGFKAQALLGGFVIGNCAALGAATLWFPAFRGRFRSELFMRIARFGWPSSVSAFSFATIAAQRYLLQFAGGAAAVGIFAAAGDFSTQTIGLLIGTATLAGQPLAFRARDLGHDQRLREQLQNNARLTFGVGFAAAVGVIVLAESITHIYFGPRFRGGAAPVMAVTAVYVLLAGLRTSYFEQVFEIAMNTRPLVILTLFRIAAGLIPSVYLIAHFGALGAAGALVIAEICAISVTAVWATRLIRLPFPIMSFGKIILATAVMVAGIEIVPHRDSALGLVAAILAGFLAYAGALALLHTRELRSLWHVQSHGRTAGPFVLAEPADAGVGRP